MPAARRKKSTSRKPASRKMSTRKSTTKSSSKSSSSSSGGSTQQSVYNKLIKKGMSPKQAAAFSKQAAKRSKKSK